MTKALLIASVWVATVSCHSDSRGGPIDGHGDSPDGSVDGPVGADAPGADAPSQADATEGDLPPPADDTVEMLLNGARFTLVDVLDCRSGLSGIGFQLTSTPGNTLPDLNLHKIDLATSDPVVIMAGADHTQMDIDDSVNGAGIVWEQADAGCTASVVESSATKYELKLVGCALKNELGGPETGTVSFRARCTKQP